jgi:hypothetical protein
MPTVGRFNPKTFGQPDLLKTIAPGILLRILRPCQEFLAAAGLPLPESEDGEINYLQLATILASPDERMNSNVIESLHVITSLGTEDNFDDLLDIARRNFVDVDVQATAADLAARIWMEVPEALELKDREQMVSTGGNLRACARVCRTRSSHWMISRCSCTNSKRTWGHASRQ